MDATGNYNIVLAHDYVEVGSQLPSTTLERESAYILGDSVTLLTRQDDKWTRQNWSPPKPIYVEMEKIEKPETALVDRLVIKDKSLVQEVPVAEEELTERIDISPSDKINMRGFKGHIKLTPGKATVFSLSSGESVDDIFKVINDPSVYFLPTRKIAKEISEKIEDDRELLSPNAIERSLQLHVAAQLIGRVATLKGISDEKLEALKTLTAESVINFRSAVSEVVRQTSRSPENPTIEFPVDAASDIYTREVAPRLSEINRTLNSNGIGRRFYEEYLINPYAWAEVLGAIVVSELTRIKIAEAIIGAGGLAVGHALKAENNRRQILGRVSNDDLYFLYQLRELSSQSLNVNRVEST